MLANNNHNKSYSIQSVHVLSEIGLHGSRALWKCICQLISADNTTTFHICKYCVVERMIAVLQTTVSNVIF